ncbi:1-acyl-sn-glycerol-3-phosphate acyltransferase [Corallincola holothuriorum]|uniref:1-acyl-sn-glycerol-3-phosphate acyltransferase n=1 Tax=Corallincola holothuriorum TaxID=2282215 RepID=A0A368NRN7_9GAMM|nr:lysophospholipid acyltransferase family protein [Corallincola holothuriorum]RCU52780.1 1-acyl-sn-glycerol-3-phosphate acyltransferase [Corallincola holothuriorum]
MINTISKTWRVIATGFCFLSFGLGGFLLTIFVFPAIYLIAPKPARRRNLTQSTISKAFLFFTRVMQHLGVMELSTQGIEALKLQRGAIIVANHPSLIDIVLLGAMMERFDCIVKQKLWQHPLLGGVMRAAGFIPNNAGESVIQTCQSHLQEGRNIVIFPEGTRTVPAQPLKLQRGAAQIALRTGAPIRLVHITCVPTTLAKNEPWYNVPTIKPHFSLKVGKLIQSNEFLGDGKEYSVAARQLTRYLAQRLEEERK